MFEAKLKSRSQPKLGALAVTFPIPEERYETMIFALQNLQIGDVRKQDCCIESIRAPDCPALLRMTNTMANVDELDWLGKQLESFDRYELLQFNAAVERFGLSAADELIDLSFCAREVTVVSDFKDLELVGKRHYLTVHGACDSEELENLDGKETALALISGQPGYVTRYGVVYDNGIKLEQAYDRKHLPPIWMPESCIMELKLRATGEDDPKKQEWVQLPASRMKLERAMLRAGIASCGEMQILVTDSRFPDEVDCTLNVEHGSLFELNRLCHACSGFKEQDFKKLGAVCQMAKPTCAANIRQLAEDLDQFDFAPNVHTPEELGKYTLGASLKEIAAQMSKTGSAYDEGKSWNKNMVARILENAKYTGVDGYPKLVDINLLEAAAEKRQTKQQLPERTPAQKALKRVCSKPPTPEIEQQVTHLIGRLAEQPERITQPERTSAPVHTNAQAELDDILNTQPLDEDAARSLICKLAREQYDAIGNEEYETERLRRLFAAFECTAELNAELPQSAVTAVLVTRQTVRLQLKNGQIIGKDDLV